jgi:hypothetical protein
MRSGTVGTLSKERQRDDRNASYPSAGPNVTIWRRLLVLVTGQKGKVRRRAVFCVGYQPALEGEMVPQAGPAAAI